RVLALVLGVQLRHAEAAAEALERHQRRRALAERDRLRVGQRQEPPEAPQAPRRGGEPLRGQRAARGGGGSANGEVDVDRPRGAARAAGEEPLIIVDRVAAKTLEL